MIRRRRGIHACPARSKKMTPVLKNDPFDRYPVRYDQWFDSPRGKLIFAEEAAALAELRGTRPGRWLEVGVGTGRFAGALDIREGIDLSAAVLAIAVARGIRVCRAAGEWLPFRPATFDGVLMVVTICFLDEPGQAFAACARVLKPGGRLIAGVVPADSPWGRLYRRQGGEGHLFYSAAKFYNPEQVIQFATSAGLSFDDARSCLFAAPGEPLRRSVPRQEIVPGAGFVALAFRKPRRTGW